MVRHEASMDHLHTDEPPLSEANKVILKRVAEQAIQSDIFFAIKAGVKAPAFCLADIKGGSYNLPDILRKGPVVLVFFRGLWCWYSIKKLRLFEERVSEITCRGAALVAITPQVSFTDQELQRLDQLSYPIMFDQNNSTGKKYGISHRPPPELSALSKSPKANLKAIQQKDGTDHLPYSAQFVINRNGIVVLSDVDADYTHLPNTDEILIALDCMPSSRSPRSF